MGGEKTEEATPRRLERARRDGDVPRSRDLVAFVVLAVALLAFGPTARSVAGILRTLAKAAFARVAAGSASHEALSFLLSAMRETAFALAPLGATLVAVAVVVARLDAGPVFAPARLAPSLANLDPVAGLGRLFSRERAAEALKALAVFALVASVTVLTFEEWMPSFARLPGSARFAAADVAAGAIRSLAERALGVFAALAAFDVVRSRRAHARRHRMTKDEVRREHKESEGDPHLRGERQRMHREILEHAALEAVRRASVLVVNPTHLAVALHFDEDSDQEAPEVLAKGEDHLALRMIEAAREAGVPVMRDIPLARGLYGMELGDSVPEPLFEAVAAVLRAAEEERRRGG